MHPLQMKAELNALAELFKKELVDFERHSGLIISQISIARFDKSDTSQIKDISIHATVKGD